MLLQQISMQPASRLGAAPGLRQEIEGLAFVIVRSPEPMVPVPDIDRHLVLSIEHKR